MDHFYEYPNWNMRIGVVNRERERKTRRIFIHFLRYAVMIFENSTYIHKIESKLQ
jgi:hypothetical protein